MYLIHWQKEGVDALKANSKYLETMRRIIELCVPELSERLSNIRGERSIQSRTNSLTLILALMQIAVATVFVGLSLYTSTNFKGLTEYIDLLILAIVVSAVFLVLVIAWPAHQIVIPNSHVSRFDIYSCAKCSESYIFVGAERASYHLLTHQGHIPESQQIVISYKLKLDEEWLDWYLKSALAVLIIVFVLDIVHRFPPFIVNVVDLILLVTILVAYVLTKAYFDSRKEKARIIEFVEDPKLGGIRRISIVEYDTTEKKMNRLFDVSCLLTVQVVRTNGPTKAYLAKDIDFRRHAIRGGNCYASKKQKE